MSNTEDLQATFERAVSAINSRDIELLETTWDDDIVVVSPDVPFPAEGRVADRQGWQALFASSESVTVTPINPHYRVIGDTGVVWFYYAMAVKPIDGPLQTTFGRATLTYVKTNGEWQEVVGHISRMPS